MSLGPSSNFVPTIYAGTRKNKYNKKNGQRKSKRTFDNVHSLQKGLKGIFSAEEFAEIMANAQERTKELRKIVDSM